MGSLGKHLRASNAIPFEVIDELTTPEDPMRGRLCDGWYANFQIKEVSKGKFFLYSSGPDLQPSTEDDLRIGTFSKESNR